MKTVGKGYKEFQRRMAALPGFADMSEELMPHFRPLVERGRVLLGPEENTGTAPMTDFTLPEYGQSWFSAVTEPSMPDRPCWNTEKPFKPLVNFHPFVTFGSPGALQLLRDLGFETFEGLIDETYDTVDEPRARFDMIYGQVTRLCRMDEAELARLSGIAEERVVHNARWGLIQFPRQQRDEAHWALLGEILAAVGRR